MNSSVAYLTDFDRVELVPLSLMKILIEVNNELCMDEVDKSVANITIVLNKHKSTL